MVCFPFWGGEPGKGGWTDLPGPIKSVAAQRIQPWSPPQGGAHTTAGLCPLDRTSLRRATAKPALG